MPALIAVFVLVAVVGFLWFYDLAPVGMSTLIVIRNGQVKLSKAHLRPATLSDLKLLLEQAGIQSGHVGIANRRVVFSRSIPPTIHQQIRNVLLHG